MTVPEHRTATALLPAVPGGGAREAIRFGSRALGYDALAGAAGAVAQRAAGSARVAGWAVPELETCVAVVGALLAGGPIVPLKPQGRERELAPNPAGTAPAGPFPAPGGPGPGAPPTLPP